MSPLSCRKDRHEDISKLTESGLPYGIRRRILVVRGRCWKWQGYKFAGYGRLRYKGIRTQKAHRVIYQLLVGPLSDSLTLDHLCRNRDCVNPAHLEPVSLQENLRRGVGVGSVNKAKTHCRNGHPYRYGNTYFYGARRCCRICIAANNKAYRERKKAHQHGLLVKSQA